MQSVISNQNLGKVVSQVALLALGTAFTLTTGTETASAAALYQITGLGYLPGTPQNVPYPASYATGINNSGQIVGYSTSASGYQAFIYSNGQITGLGSLPGYPNSYATGINDLGQVVGYTQDNNSDATQAFLYSNGSLTGLGSLPGYSSSKAYGINNQGQIVGTAITPNSTQAFLYSNGAFTGLGGLPGYPNSQAYGINNQGQVVGATASSNSYELQQAFLYSNNTLTGLGSLPGYSSSTALAINDSGQIVGYFTDSTGQFNQPFVYNGNTITPLGAPSYRSYGVSAAQAINAQGQIVGAQGNYKYLSFAAIGDTKGSFTNLNVLAGLGASPSPGSGWFLEYATGINNQGQIVGTGLYNGQTQAFLLTPITSIPVSTPEPNFWVALGFVGTIALASRKRH